MRAGLLALVLGWRLAAGGWRLDPAAVRTAATTGADAVSTEKRSGAQPPAASQPSAVPIRPGSDAGSLAREAGHGRPAVLHFWATWCDACRDEFPRIRKVLNRLPAQNVGVLLVSIDRPDKLDEVKRDLRRFRVSRLPAVVLDAPDPEPVAKAVGDPAWDGTLPSTFVFDSGGKLTKSFLGRTGAAALETAVRAVR
ncbi:MAG: TlpA family protein disulfide reductase [Myxococcales bacterium]